MKKVVFILLSTLIILSACSSEEEPQAEKVEEEPVFTEDDIELTHEMIMYAHDLEKEFVEEANKKWEELKEQDPELYNADNHYNELDKIEREESIKEIFDPMATEMIIKPFFNRYEKYLIANKKNNLPAINFTKYSQEGESANVTDDYTFYPTYDHLSLESEKVQEIEDYNIHELVVNLDKENTVFYKDFESDTIGTSMYVEPSDKITFYKSDGKIIIGRFPILGEYQNKLSFDSEHTSEKTKELLDELPPLE